MFGFRARILALEGATVNVPFKDECAKRERAPHEAAEQPERAHREGRDDGRAEGKPSRMLLASFPSALHRVEFNHRHVAGAPSDRR